MLYESAAACHAAVAVLGVEGGIDEWYERCLVDILVDDDVTECVIAFIDIYSHSFVYAPGVVCLYLAANIQRIFEM